MAEISDQELYASVKLGNVKAFETLFRKYYDVLSQFSASMVRDLDVAEEITQEIFIYIWEKRDQITLRGALKSYLYSSVRNKSINYLKLELPKAQATSDLSEAKGLSYTPMVSDETELLKLKIQHAIDELPEKCKHIFVLSRYGGMTNGEIAEEMDLSIKTVENQMTIALRRLKERLNDELKSYNLR